MEQATVLLVTLCLHKAGVFTVPGRKASTKISVEKEMRMGVFYIIQGLSCSQCPTGRDFPLVSDRG